MTQRQDILTLHILLLLNLSFSVVCFDAKLNFDDNAAFRQQEVFAMDDISEMDPREVEAARLKLNYIGLDGSIGCLGMLLTLLRLECELRSCQNA